MPSKDDGEFAISTTASNGYRRQECVALARAAVPLILRVLIDGHGERLLLHALFNTCDGQAVDLISVGLGHWVTRVSSVELVPIVSYA